jgi:KaiC/GvpD/RAD55 family RecA-like ATPase
MSMMFQKATKQSARLRMSLIGVAGSGKTYTALNIARHLGNRVAVIDTERGSASKYSDMFDFDVLELESFSPNMYVDAIQAAEEAGYDVLIIDSLSHAWTGKGGALDMVDKTAKRSQSGNTFGAWRDVTPLHNTMVDAIINARMHIITTMRAKTEYVQEKNEKTGRVTVRKVGLAPVQRDGLEYEFDVVADLDQDNNLIVGKTRCPAVAGAVIPKAGKEIALKLKAWLSEGGDGNKAEAPLPKAKAEPKAEKSEKPMPVSTDAEAFYDDEDAPHCHCGVEAKYVRGRSGNGWVCGHQGTGEPTCDFRMKEAAPLTDEVDGDPFREPAGVELNGVAHV